MGNDKNKIKTGRAIEQEYGHDYPVEQYPGYKYNDDDKRVEYHVISDTSDGQTRDTLYGINPEDSVQDSIHQTTNRIRARLNTQNITEDHKERAYRVNTTAPIFSKTDPGQESYALENDPRADEVNKIRQTSRDFDQTISQEHSMDLSNPLDRFSLVDDSNDTQIVESKKNFREGLSVKHTEEKIAGEIKFVGVDKIAVVWEDQTRERFTFAEAEKNLEIVTEAYIDTTQDEVDPLDSTENDVNLASEANSILDAALAALGADENDEVIEDGNPNKKFDLEKAKLQRKVDKLESQVKASNIDKIKRKAAEELVDLMQEKGMLEKTIEAAENQISLIMDMDDKGYESFKNVVVGKKMDAADIALAALNQDDDFSDIEDGHAYSQVKEAIKKSKDKTGSRTVDGIVMGDTSAFENGSLVNFKGVVGDFSSYIAGNNNNPETRSIKRRDALASSDTKLDFSGFQDLQGITKPINIPSKEVTAGSKYSDLFNGMEWTTISKIH